MAIATDGERTAEHPIVDLGPAALVGTRAGASDADPVTGEVPVADLADGHLHVDRRRDVTILRIDGALDRALADRLAPEITQVVTRSEVVAVALDVESVVLLDREAYQHVVEAIDADPSTARCIVNGRLSGRMVLDRWGVRPDIAVFTSVGDALQARAFDESGYGCGWGPRR